MPTALNLMLERWNGLDPAAAAETILPCNGSRAWAEAIVAEAPFRTPEELFRASDEVWRGLGASDRQQAYDSHPRLGEQQAKAATAQSAEWSRGEQSAAQAGGAGAAAALAEANRRYEAKFGRTFLLCATGKSTDEILHALDQRLGNDATTEGEEASEQQRQITQLRLRKWLGETVERAPR